jgi:hypothetical protein
MPWGLHSEYEVIAHFYSKFPLNSVKGVNIFSGTGSRRRRRGRGRTRRRPRD